MGSEDISVIRHWTNEISNYGSRTADPAASVMVRALEALEATTTPYYDHDHMDRALTTLRNELPDALRASGEDAFRLSVVGLVESVHRALRNVAERRRRDEPHLVRPADDYGHASYGLLQRGAYAIKPEPVDDWALPDNVLEEEEAVHVYEEEVAVKKEPAAAGADDDYNNNHSYALLTPVVVVQPQEAIMPLLERMEPGEQAPIEDPHAAPTLASRARKLQQAPGGPAYPASPVKVKVEQLDEDREDSPARPSKRSKALRQSGDSGPNKKKTERRSRKEAGETAAPKRRGSRPVHYTEKSEGEVAQGRAAKRPKMLNIKKEELSGALACVLCDYQTAAVGAFICHLKKRHGTTPAKMGIWFRCECGHLSRSNGHSYRKKEPGCGGTSSTLIFVAGGLAKQEMLHPGEEDEEWKPPRAAAGAEAVEGYGRTEWRGAELRADEEEMVDVTHVTPAETSLDGRAESREGSPAEATPAPTPRPKRSSTARPINYSELAGIADEEEEVVEVPAVRSKQRKIRAEEDEALMKCVLCELSVLTVHTYIHHLKAAHGTTATKEGIWFRCACGNMSQSGWHASSKTCDDRAASLATVVYGVEKKMDVDDDERNDEEVDVEEEEENQKEKDDDVIDGAEENLEVDDAVVEEEFVEEGGGYLEIVQLNDSSRVLNEFGLEEEKVEEPEDETKEEDASSIAQRCHICKKHSPRTIGQFVDHLRKRHDTTLMKSGCWLKCACGAHVTSYATVHLHSKAKDCDGSSFAVKRV